MEHELVQIGDEIILQREEKTSKQIAIVGTHYCFARKLIVEGDAITTVNVPITLTVKSLSWQNEPISDVPNARIQVNGQEIDINLVEGKAEFDLECAIPGRFALFALSDNVDSCEVEVIVNET